MLGLTVLCLALAVLYVGLRLGVGEEGEALAREANRGAQVPKVVQEVESGQEHPANESPSV